MLNLKKAPLLLPAAGMISGTLLSGFLNEDLIVYGIYLFILAALTLLSSRRISPAIGQAAVYTIGLLTALILVEITAIPEPKGTGDIWKFSGKIVRARQLVTRNQDRTLPYSFILKLDTVNGSHLLKNTQIKCIIRNPGVSGQRLFPGDRIVAAGIFSNVPRPDVPGLFDYSTYLKQNRLCGIVLIPSQNGILRHQSGSLLGIQRNIHAIRMFLAERLNCNFSGRTQAFLRAVLLGDGSTLDREFWTMLKKTGTMHFIAISGLHIGLLSFLVWFIFSRILSPQAGCTAALLTAIFYCLLSGMSISATRATVMVGVFSVSAMIHRRYNPLNSLSLACMILLFMNPAAIYNPGFQLSFLAVCGILALYPALKNNRKDDEWEQLEAPSDTGRKVVTYLADIFRVSVSATGATFFCVAWFFHIITPLSFALNTLLLPFFTLLLIAGLIYTFIPILITPLIQLLAWVFTEIIVFISTFPWFCIHVRQPCLWLLFLYIVSLSAVLFFVRKPRKKSRLVLSCIVSGIILMLVTGRNGLNGKHQAVFLNSGDANSVILSCPGTVHIFDTGLTDALDISRTDAYLQYMGVNRIDNVFISHWHFDHAGALPVILRNFPVTAVYANPPSEPFTIHQTVTGLLNEKGMKCQPLSPGNSITLSRSGAACKILAPPFHMDSWEENDRSMVQSVNLGGLTFLLTGDIREKGSLNLLQHQPQSPGRYILQIPHHGRSFEYLSRLIEQYHPLAAVICSDAKPNPALRKTCMILREKRIPYFITGRDGSVFFRKQDNTWQIHLYKRGRWHYYGDVPAGPAGITLPAPCPSP